MIIRLLERGRKLSILDKAVLIPAIFLSVGSFNFSYAEEAEDLEVAGFVENETRVRHGLGFSKIRNTLQIEFAKAFGSVGLFSNLQFNGTFRGTYDSVYDVNDDEYGDEAGGPIEFTSGGVPAGVLGPTAVPAGITTPWGSSLVTAGNPGLPGGGGFGFDVTNNPNEGLVLLGSGLHGDDGGVLLGVPVRPCNEDSRGCIDDYLDYDKHELASPEFNDRFDFIREAYLTGTIPLSDGRQLDLSFGRQQVVWGRTDLFRVLDVINPVDFSRNNIYDELEDIRIPMGIFTAEHRWGATETFDDLNLQFLWKFEKFRPNNLGQGGSPNSILDAGSFFRGMHNCWENGCTVSNFAGGGAQTDFPAHTIGIRDANLPEWQLGNTDVGLKFEGVYKGVGFSLNALSYISQFPTLRAGRVPARNPFLADGFGPFPADASPTGVETGGDLLTRDHLIAFDIEFPRVNLFGASADIYSETLKTAFRFEGAYTSGEEFANTLEPRLFSESDVIRWVIGADRPTFIPFLNKNRAFLFSAQLFGQHLLDHEEDRGPLGKRGMPDWEDNFIGTLLIKGWYKNDRLSPQIITAYDVRAKAATIAPSLDWLITDKWRLNIGANIKLGHGARSFDDARTANPFPPFTCPATDPACVPGGAMSQSLGLGGYEPLGRFRSGPIGMAQNEDEIYFSIRYRF
ncbi:MAG: DUF1302 family protein [Gammaproteobacteria bacterium]